MTRLWTCRAAAIAGIVALALPAVNCHVSGGQVRCGYIPGSGKVAGPRDHYLFIAGKPRNTGFTARPDRRLVPPFRWEGKHGLLDPKHDDLGSSSFGISVLGDLGGFASVTISLQGDGIDVAPFIQGNGPEPALTTLHVAGRRAAEVAIEHDGTFLRVFARAVGDDVYQELGDRPAGTGGYQPSLDGDTLPVGVKVCFDNLNVPFTGRPPALTPIETLREDTYLAADAVIAAGIPADGPAPDAQAALLLLNTARDRLDAVVAAAPGAGASAVAKRKLGVARTKVRRAISAVEGGKPEASWYRVVLAAAKAILRSTTAIK
jgi:hypothetical protein